MMKKCSTFALLLCFLVGWPALAQDPNRDPDRIDVVKASGRASIDFSALRRAPGADTVFATVLQEDLLASGYFVPGAPQATDFRVMGTADGGQVELRAVRPGAGRAAYSVRLGYENGGEARQQAHVVADEMLQRLLGKRGFATARLLVVGNESGHKELYVCDWDGQNRRRLTRDRSISISPAWAPDGDSLFYTSYMGGNPDIYRVDLSSGARRRVAGFGGLNTGAAVSPDGRSLAMVLSRDGKPEVYVMDLASRRLTRVTNTRSAAKSSPSWSPDGRFLVYVSGERGIPQLFRVGRNGGRPTQLTHGTESVAPDWGPGGIIYSTRGGGRYQLALLDPASGRSTILMRDGADYENPSWAPNGRHVVVTRTINYRSSVYLLDTQERDSLRPLLRSDGRGGWFAPTYTR